MTKSLLIARIVSKLIVLLSKPPAFGRAFACGGKSETLLTAAICFSAPASNKISVDAAPREIIRSGIFFNVTVLPVPSVAERSVSSEKELQKMFFDRLFAVKRTSAAILK